MRLWSLHPGQLDRVGLVACWREALLAQAVLADRTQGYRNHPQLERFREQSDPLEALGAYLVGLSAEAIDRGYRFDASKILRAGAPIGSIDVTTGQLEFEWRHLGAKLEARSPADAARWREDAPAAHPSFTVRPGPIASWERP